MISWCKTVITSPLGSTISVLSFGGRRVIIDTGHPGHAADTVARLEAQGLLVGVEAILLTHSHADHVGAAAALHDKTGAPVLSLKPVVHGKFLAEQARLKLVPPRYTVDRCLADGEILECAGEKIAVLHTPGHSDDHACFFLESRRALFCGDLFGHEDIGTLDVMHSWRESLDMMVGSVRRVVSLKPLLVFPGHSTHRKDVGRLFEQVEKRFRTYRGSPTILVAHTMMPLLLLLIASQGTMSMDAVRAYTVDHIDFFQGFMEGIGVEMLNDELDKIVVILELKGILHRENDMLSLTIPRFMRTRGLGETV